MNELNSGVARTTDRILVQQNTLIRQVYAMDGVWFDHHCFHGIGQAGMVMLISRRKWRDCSIWRQPVAAAAMAGYMGK